MIKKFNLLFVTMFSIGYFKYAPGTLASLITCIIFWFFSSRGDTYAVKKFSDVSYVWVPINIFHLGTIVYLYFFLVLLFFYSLYAIKNVSKNFESNDPKEIVIDEFFGQLIPLSVIYYYFTIYLKLYAKMKVAHNVSIKREVFSFIGDDISYTYAFYIIIAFMLFRAFDILKPFPINYIDNKIKNNFGIMSDDLLAGIFTAIIIAIPMIILS